MVAGPTAVRCSSERSAPPAAMAMARKVIDAAPPTTSRPASATSRSGAGGITTASGMKAKAAAPPTTTLQARALAAKSRWSGTGTARRIQKALRSACMCVSGPMVAM